MEMINVSRLKEACTWLCSGEEYTAYHKNLTIRLSPIFMNSIKLTLLEYENKRGISVIISPHDFPHFSIILDEQLTELRKL